MIKNIIIGKNSHVTNSLVKFLDDKIVFSSNEFSQENLKKLNLSKK